MERTEDLEQTTSVAPGSRDADALNLLASWSMSHQARHEVAWLRPSAGMLKLWT